MKTRKLLLTMPEAWFVKFEKVMKEQHFTSVQELIYDALRTKYVRPKPEPKGLRGPGRPKKMQFEDYFSRPTKESRRIEGK